MQFVKLLLNALAILICAAAPIYAWNQMDGLLRGFMTFVLMPRFWQMCFLVIALCLLSWACWTKKPLILGAFLFWVFGVGAWITWWEMLKPFRTTHPFANYDVVLFNYTLPLMGYMVRTSFLALVSTLVFRPPSPTMKDVFLIARPCLAIWLSLSFEGYVITLFLYETMWAN